MNVDLKLHLLGEQQHGLLTNRQLRGIGLSRDGVRQRVRKGLLVAVGPGIYRLRGVPSDPLQRAHAAVLDAGLDAALSHDSAAAMFDLPRFELEPLHVWRRRGRADHPDRLAIQHLTRRLMPNHVVKVHGIRATTPTRTLLDQAARLEPWAVERLLEDELAMGLTSYQLIDRMLRSMSRQGRTGLTLVRALNEARGPNYRPAESNLERRAILVLAEAGMEGFERQVEIEDEVGWIARVDLRHRAAPLIVEVQSDRYHAALLDQVADLRRIRALERAGYVVVEVSEHDVWHDAATVVDRVSDGIDRARQRPLVTTTR